jgi:hypothetical protein
MMGREVFVQTSSPRTHAAVARRDYEGLKPELGLGLLGTGRLILMPG